MIHRLFTVASALSFVLCLAAAIQWARSYGHYDQLRLTWFNRLWVVESCHGQLSVATVGGWPVNELIRFRSVAADVPPEGIPIFTYGNADVGAMIYAQESVRAWLIPSYRYGVARTGYNSNGTLPAVGQWQLLTISRSRVATPLLRYWQCAFLYEGILGLLLPLPVPYAFRILLRQ